ncbi:YjgP/YjgQ family permease [Algibacter amylolyticus]|uniref:YjgP/YjgQ family permease n=1 Tax=Algibacter amylolyticus TaxID=1608400 RepID=A0A5M7B8S8_9FLAO|nr:YjgP/YjgQ family permease [Algibacter amylolyticus]TSJ74289.1 YjgP/YjgQ family permease [Algibacter amylolyticus]
MKILDRYIITTYLKTFFSVFIILMLIFVLQTIWLYIKELAGKDLDIVIIFKFLAYFMPKLIPLVLPLTILLASIMVFGSFAENYEFAAMKSTGISLQRAMSGLSIFIVGLGIVTFFFSNNVIPWAELNSYNLRKNIAKLKPSMAIAEGQFNPIESTPYNIKVEKKSGDRNQYLEDVTIHLKGDDGRSNATVITSKKGELASQEDSNVLKLILTDGYYYSDINPKKRADKNKKPFVKSKFETKIINIDLSNMNDVDFDEQSQTDKYNMLDVNGLTKTIDSLVLKYNDETEAFSKNLLTRTGITQKMPTRKRISDTINYDGPILDLFDTKQKIQLVDVTSKSMISSKQFINTRDASMKVSKTWLNRHVISLHEKFALGFACVILFFVGAPLGALIRKGGIGLPLVIAILLFLTYHFIGIFAMNSAKSGDFNPILAPWFSTLLMLPLGVFLTKRATADRGLVDFGGIVEPFKKLFKIKEKDAVDFKFLQNYNNEELINTINNFDTLNHDETVKHKALELLTSRGLTTSDLRASNLAINESYDTTEAISTNYKEHSKFALVLYIIGIVLLILFFVFKNNKLVPLATASTQLSIISLILFVVYYIKSIINSYQFYNQINKTENKPGIGLLILGLPLYFIVHFLLREKMKTDLKAYCLESLK